MKHHYSFIALLIGLLFFVPKVNAANTEDEKTFLQLSENGSWMWLSKPNAVYYEGTKKQTYFTWVDNTGSILVASYNHENDSYLEKVVKPGYYADMTERVSPSILVRGEGQILLFYPNLSAGTSASSTIPTFCTATQNNEDISSWKELGNTAYGEFYYPCPNFPFIVGDDIYMLIRGKNGPAFIIQPNGNVPTHANYNTISNTTTLNNRFEFYQVGNNLPEEERLVMPYTVACQGSDGAIHIAVSHSHPDFTGDNNNIVHYLKLKDRKFYKANGAELAELAVKSFEITNIPDPVYTPTEQNGNKKSWVQEIALDGSTPVILYTTIDEDGNHAYNYARWNGTAWANTLITEAGTAIAESQPYFSGGITFDAKNPSIVYLSKKTAGGNFEIYKYTTVNDGANWTQDEALTDNTPEGTINMRPVSVKNYPDNSDFNVLWMRGSYTNATDFNTAIVYQGDPNAPLDRIEFDATSYSLTQGFTKQLDVYFFPSYFVNKNLQWTSDNSSVASVSEDGLVTALGAGTTKITATSIADNTKKAECTITVAAATYFTNAFFDFGTAESEVAPGALKVSSSTVYGESGYGWESTSKLFDRFRNGPAESIEKRGMILGPSASVFKVNVENGDYYVVVRQGDNDYQHDNMALKANGEEIYSGLTTPKGTFNTKVFEVTIDNKLLELEFSKETGGDANWVANSVRISTTPPVVGIEPTPDFEYFNNPETLIEVYDIYGRKITDEKLGNSSYNDILKAKNTPNGIYIVNFSLNQQAKAKKIFFTNK